MNHQEINPEEPIALQNGFAEVNQAGPEEERLFQPSYAPSFYPRPRPRPRPFFPFFPPYFYPYPYYSYPYYPIYPFSPGYGYGGY
ncbi:hypothetical protein [Oceanobacillus damuensis]|uniref:hypothetical protein n=1 Tax=Oceanobacillus damuensis TaxID=937928 RepID=UPI0018FEF398|nr:hypothetical protein [Oceanobacillus damuensis]